MRLPLPAVPLGLRARLLVLDAVRPHDARRVGSSLTTEAEGFNWSDSLRSRAERSSMSAGAGTAANGAAPASTGHVRTPSQTAPSPAAPAPAPPAPKRLSQKPDAFQERILKGDFYMD